MRSASRTVGRLTSSRAASSRSGGRRSPATRRARSTATLTCSTTAFEALRVVTGRNSSVGAVTGTLQHVIERSYKVTFPVPAASPPGRRSVQRDQVQVVLAPHVERALGHHQDPV